MSGNKLSPREAALIARARAGLQRKPAQQRAAAAPPAPAADASASHPAVEKPAPNGAMAATAAEPAERVAALLAAARAESAGRRQRQRRLYVWAPVAFVSVAGLWTLLWLWHRL